MAIVATVETEHGESRELYIRVNNVEASNHGATSIVKFRGFLSQEAFNQKKHYLYEKDIEMVLDVSEPLWEQAYKELKKSGEVSDAKDA